VSTVDIRTATTVDSSHLTGISYAAVQTMVSRHPVRGTLIGLATDGNGRTTSVVGIDDSLGLLAQHLQVLQAHHEGQNIRDYLPGYMDSGTIYCSDGELRQPRSTTLVWVLS
jgi:hypothetical protein